MFYVPIQPTKITANETHLLNCFEQSLCMLLLIFLQKYIYSLQSKLKSIKLSQYLLVFYQQKQKIVTLTFSFIFLLFSDFFS